MSLIKEILSIKSTKKELREFAFIVGGVLLLIGGLRWWHHKNYAFIILAAGTALVSLGALIPNILRPLQKAWMTLALLMGWVMTRVILTVLYFLVLTPISLIARMTGKQFLNLKFREPKLSSYWVIRETGATNNESYEKQF